LALSFKKSQKPCGKNRDVSENSGTPKSSILIGFSIINNPFWGSTIFGNTHMDLLPHKLNGWNLKNNFL